VAQDPDIAQVVSLLHDTAKVDYIAPGHCTGEPSFAALQQAFGDHYLYAGLGAVLSLDARPRPLLAALRRPIALDPQDRATYETLYAHSEDARSDDSSLFASAQWNVPQ
jgi:7,8-dihydropterin-6-yl-methyl-4-(beta-D-ribofuranosyl)aminobenzene 5'-phosphate synthase